MLIGALIAHHTHAADLTEQDDTCLPDLIVQRHLNVPILHISRNAGSQDLTSLLATEFHLILPESSDIDIICILQDTNLLGGDVT